MRLRISFSDRFNLLRKSTNSATIANPVPEKPSSGDLGTNRPGCGHRGLVQRWGTRLPERLWSLSSRPTFRRGFTGGFSCMNVGKMEDMSASEPNENLLLCQLNNR